MTAPPLTAAEIEEMREYAEWQSDGFTADPSTGHSTKTLRLLDELERARAALRLAAKDLEAAAMCFLPTSGAYGTIMRHASAARAVLPPEPKEPT